MLKKIPILTYHQVAPLPASGAPFRDWTVAPAQFVRHMELLRQRGYQGLSMRELLPYLRGEKRGKVVGITFDDGFQNVITHALPVLKAAGYTATNYLVANHLGGTNFWDARHGAPEHALMSLAEVQQWLAAGNEVGSHTLDHVDLLRTTDTEAREQVLRSKTQLETITGQPIHAFAYPYGRFSNRDVALVTEAGYTSAVSTATGRAGVSHDLGQLPRLNMLANDSIQQFSRKVFSPQEDLRAAWRRLKKSLR